MIRHRRSLLDDSDNDPDVPLSSTACYHCQDLRQNSQKKSHVEDLESLTQAAVKESCNDARVVAIEKEKHYEILNKLLDDNRMKLVKVPPDGNCFISATL